ncbi:hypothetical protein BKA58DRAFT_442173 [Alternaria rosae]|uniref:uncharacterized protein n=1 Tax=Alternaria rosae TaxID=1187941 RepID=UPI001E8E4411|nr:uncharacterized protein BKA58DRAFT_442173 [Alternaria rosae]KAH6865386.1 hypothetical protein BKA58DRAFT_442173 [Alternaria rosae]
MRYPKGLEWWPVEILCTLSDLADETLGIDNWNNVYDLLVEGNKKRMKYENNTLLAEIQLSDISYVRERVRAEEEEGRRGGKKRREEEEGRRGGKKRREEEEGRRGGKAEDGRYHGGKRRCALFDPPDDTDDANATTKPDESAGATVTTNASDGPTNQQADDSEESIPAAILPTNSQEAKIKKWNFWINHHWQVQDYRDLILKEMLQRSNDKEPIRNRELKSYGTKQNGEVLELLNERAKITGIQRKNSAWAKIVENWGDRAPRSGRNSEGEFSG